MALGVSFGPRFARVRVTARSTRVYGSVGVGPVSYAWRYGGSSSTRRRSATTHQSVTPTIDRPETPEEARAAVAARVEKTHRAHLKRTAHPLRYSMGEAVKVLVGLVIVLTVVLSPILALIFGVALVVR